MSSFDVDLFVIGAGSGGVRAARIAAGYGARVVIAEEYRDRRHLRDPRLRAQEAVRLCQPLRGRCSRTPPASAGPCREPTLRLADAASPTRTRRSPGSRRSTSPTRKAGVEISRAAPCSRTPTRSGLSRPARASRAGYILVATGGHPTSSPPIPGIELAITSNEVFHLEQLPQRDPDRRRRLHRGRVRRLFAGARRRGHLRLSRRQDPARLRRGRPRRASTRGLSSARHQAHRPGRPSTRIEPGRRRHRVDAHPTARTPIVGEVAVRHRPAPQHRRPRPREAPASSSTRSAPSWSTSYSQSLDAVDLCGRRRHQPRST